MIRKKKRLNRDGLPMDALDWLYEDWKDLYDALMWAFARIRERHKEQDDGQTEMQSM